MEKRVDSKGRWRNVIVSFRVSPEENKDLNRRVKLSGLTKQDYIISRISERDVIVQWNTRVHKALRDRMDEVISELRSAGAECVTDVFLDDVKLIAKIYGDMKEGCE